jgi:hypothetical protein
MVGFRDDGGVPGVAGFILYTVDSRENKLSGLREKMPADLTVRYNFVQFPGMGG